MKRWLSFFAAILYYITFLFLVLDALNLSIGPFFYGGDVHGIARGLGVHHYVIQLVFFIVLLFNRELIAQKLMRAIGKKFVAGRKLYLMKNNSISR